MRNASNRSPRAYRGFFVAFAFSQDAEREVDAFFRRSGKAIILLTVKEILEEQISKKLA